MENLKTNYQTPYKNLEMSRGLKRFFGVHKIPNIEKLLEFTLAEIYKMKWMNVVLYSELIVVLRNHGVEFK
ncbi:MAG: hypothetical protein RLZZ175_2777 [Bacteroidota bacterium]|jgi:hypothetical protein